MKNNAGLDSGMTFVLFIRGDAALIRRCGRRSSARFGVAVVYDDEEKASLYSNECRPTLHFWLFCSGRQSLGYPVVVSVVVLLTSPWKLFYQVSPLSSFHHRYICRPVCSLLMTVVVLAANFDCSCVR
jgi:hypothetical protein